MPSRSRASRRSLASAFVTTTSAAALVATIACGQPPRRGPQPATGDLATLAEPGLRALDPAAVEAVTKDLSSDAMGGRFPGSDGGALAELYVAKRFADIGLEPAGERGTYFQDVPLRQANLVAESSSIVFHTQGGHVELRGDAVLLRPNPRTEQVAIDAPVLLLGYGMARPDLGIDELGDVDLKGAIVIVFSGSPRQRDGAPVDDAMHAVLADTALRTRGLLEHGASAVIAVFDPVRAERTPWEVYRPKLVGPAFAWLEAGTPGSAPVLPYALIPEKSLDAILSRTPGAPTAHEVWERIDRGERFAPLELGTATLRITSTHTDLTARNVAALLPGETDETVVYTAHLDHVGRGAPICEPAQDPRGTSGSAVPASSGRCDDIYNGALDNAIGVSAMLAVARGFHALPWRPRRSVLFLAVTAEESGLLGSEYFTAHPTIPLDKLVANLNIDGATPFYEVHDIVALGAEHSTLAAHVAEAARVAGLAISPDPDPAQVVFIRSDQYSFVKKGIPSIFAGAGWRDASGGIEANKALSDAWGAQHYHRPSDEWRDEYRVAWAMPEIRFHFLVGLSVATAPERPRWNDGDAFGVFASKP